MHWLIDWCLTIFSTIGYSMAVSFYCKRMPECPTFLGNWQSESIKFKVELTHYERDSNWKPQPWHIWDTIIWMLTPLSPRIQHNLQWIYLRFITLYVRGDINFFSCPNLCIFILFFPLCSDWKSELRMMKMFSFKSYLMMPSQQEECCWSSKNELIVCKVLKVFNLFLFSWF